MIPKKKEEYTFVQGEGRPYELNPRNLEPFNDNERNTPVIIHLGELNGQTFEKGMPKNFHRKPGRTLTSFTKYWSPEEEEEGFDIE